MVGAQSIQNTKLSLQSLELGLPPHSLTCRRVCPPPLVQGGRSTHSLAVEGVGESQFRRGDRHCGTIGVNPMYFVGGRFKPAKRDRKQTIIDLREISTNWFENQFCPSNRLSRRWALSVQLAHQIFVRPLNTVMLCSSVWLLFMKHLIRFEKKQTLRLFFKTEISFSHLFCPVLYFLSRNRNICFPFAMQSQLSLIKGSFGIL